MEFYTRLTEVPLTRADIEEFCSAGWTLYAANPPAGLEDTGYAYHFRRPASKVRCDRRAQDEVARPADASDVVAAIIAGVLF